MQHACILEVNSSSLFFFSIPKAQTVFVTQAFTDRMTANCVSPHEVFDQQRGEEESVENAHFLPRTLSIGDKFDTRCMKLQLNDEIDDGKMDIDSSHDSLLHT